MRTFDLVVIGAGPGGYQAALDAAGRYGMRTALVEQRELGGTCLNRGCIPTKTLLHAASVLDGLRHAGEYGVEADAVHLRSDVLQSRKNQIVEQLRGGIAMLLKQKKVQVFQGSGSILDAHTVAVQTGEEVTKLDTERILIATGSVPVRPPIPGITLPGVMSSDQLLDRSEQPFDHLTIIGGGVIGVEFASVYLSMGSRVTILEALPRLISNMDRELSQSLKMLLKKRGADIHTDARVLGLESGSDGRLVCRYLEKEQEQTLETDGVLVCVGRRPCTEGLFGEGFTVEMERGRIVTDADGCTSVPGVYAIGDVTGGIMLAHAATAAGRNAVASMNRVPGPCFAQAVPACIYTEPEIASVGLTLDEAKAQGMDAESRKILTTANGKSVLSGQERGMIKVVYDRESRKILGAQLMCARASDLVSEFTQAMVSGLTVDEMARTIRPHPTFSEAITDAVRL